MGRRVRVECRYIARQEGSHGIVPASTSGLQVPGVAGRCAVEVELARFLSLLMRGGATFHSSAPLDGED